MFGENDEHQVSQFMQIQLSTNIWCIISFVKENFSSKRLSNPSHLIVENLPNIVYILIGRKQHYIIVHTKYIYSFY